MSWRWRGNSRPAARCQSASACWCSLSLDVPFADARNSSGQLNPSNAAFELTAWHVRPSLAAMVRSERPGLP